MAYGNDGFLAVAKQSSWSVAVSDATSWHYIPFISESLNTDKALISQESILSRYDEPAPREGMERVEGDIVMELNPIDCGPFLQGVMGISSGTEVLSGYVYEHTFTAIQSRYCASCALQPYSVQIYRGVDEAFQLTDGQMNTMEISVDTEAIVKFTVGMICRTTSLMVAGTASYHDAEDNSWVWHQASFSMGGTAIDDYESVRYTLDNKLSGIVLLDGTKRVGRIQRNGFREVRISGTIDLPNLDEYDNFIAQTKSRLLATFTGAGAISSGYYETFNIDIPSFRYEAFPVNVSNPNRLTAAFTGRAEYNSGSACTIKITLQNSMLAY